MNTKHNPNTAPGQIAHAAMLAQYDDLIAAIQKSDKVDAMLTLRTGFANEVRLGNQPEHIREQIRRVVRALDQRTGQLLDKKNTENT